MKTIELLELFNKFNVKPKQIEKYAKIVDRYTLIKKYSSIDIFTNVINIYYYDHYDNYNHLEYSENAEGNKLIITMINTNLDNWVKVLELEI